MSIRLFSLSGYAHLYRSLLRFCNMGGREARELVYQLNIANIDSFRFAHPDYYATESGYVAFTGNLEKMDRRPYRTEVQLYKSLAALKRNIIMDALTAEQREAAAKLFYIMRSLEFIFYKTFGVEIYDMLTVYAECTFGLEPKYGEPSVCMMKDWLLLPGA